jgi:hypothetical protein
MKCMSWRLLLALFLIILSVFVYSIHYAIFRDPHHIFIYMIGDMAFLPLEVLLVVLIIEHLLKEREKRALLHKLNMIVGTFFSEVGTRLLRDFAGFSNNATKISEHLIVTNEWSEKHFRTAMDFVNGVDPVIDAQKGNLKNLRDFLFEKRFFMLSLLENPNLLEHDSFTDLLLAIFHLSEELTARDTLEGLPQSDYEHLAGDIKRAYTLLIREWLAYMIHLKDNYPYLFSLVIRTNPLDADASPVVA